MSLNLYTANVFTNQTVTVFTRVKCGKSVAITLFSKKPPIVIAITWSEKRSTSNKMLRQEKSKVTFKMVCRYFHG